MTLASGPLLLDTNVVIFLLRGGAVGQAIDARFQLRTRSERPLLSAVTVGESLAFAEFQRWGAAKTEALGRLLREFVVIDITSQLVVQRYAEIDAFLKRSGRTVGNNDVWIAACASAANATLLTTDRDFDPLQGTHLQRVWIDPRNP